MATAKKNPVEWYFVGLAVVADVLGVLSFIGLSANLGVRLALVTVLSLCGVLVAATTVASAVALRISPRGSYYPGNYHARRIGVGLAALVVSLVLGIVLFSLAVDAKKDEAGNDQRQQGTPTTTTR